MFPGLLLLWRADSREEPVQLLHQSCLWPVLKLLREGCFQALSNTHTEQSATRREILIIHATFLTILFVKSEI